ncbi:MAG: hypothetical protein HUJ25_14690 [Crocinitomicaceae bacterium]|nr:hypothetical protein [Crocinitomicaceae bacterium]
MKINYRKMVPLAIGLILLNACGQGYSEDTSELSDLDSWVEQREQEDHSLELIIDTIGDNLSYTFYRNSLPQGEFRIYNQNKKLLKSGYYFDKMDQGFEPEYDDNKNLKSLKKLVAVTGVDWVSREEYVCYDTLGKIDRKKSYFVNISYLEPVDSEMEELNITPRGHFESADSLLCTISYLYNGDTITMDSIKNICQEYTYSLDPTVEWDHVILDISFVKYVEENRVRRKTTRTIKHPKAGR